MNKLINRLHVVTRGVTVWELLSVPPRCLPLRRRRPRSSESRLRIGSIRDAPRLVPSFFFSSVFFLPSFLPSFLRCFEKKTYRLLASFLPLFFPPCYRAFFCGILIYYFLTILLKKEKEKRRAIIFLFSGKFSRASRVAIRVMTVTSVISDRVQFQCG